MEYKQLLSLTAIGMLIIGYIPYVRDTIKGKTKPHLYSWFVGAIMAYSSFGLQFQSNAGPGMYATLFSAIVATMILSIGYRHKDNMITGFDKICLVLSLASLTTWLVIKQPVMATALIIITASVSFMPTIRKSWIAPNTETLLSYVINFFRFGVSIMALNSYTFITLGFPVAWMILNGLFVMLLLYRRKKQL